jgi:hypothetical protein
MFSDQASNLEVAIILTERHCRLQNLSCSSVSRTSPVEVQGGHDQRHQRDRKVEGVEADLNAHV